jgi:hypothetical protein
LLDTPGTLPALPFIGTGTRCLTFSSIWPVVRCRTGDRKSLVEIDAMGFHLQIVHDPVGTWSVLGLPKHPVAHLASLADSVDYARRECDEAPATIELMVDGFYAVIHQELGWPRQLVAPDAEALSVSLQPDSAHLPPATGFRYWFKRWGRAD